MSSSVPHHGHGHGHMDATGKGHHDSTHPSEAAAAASVTQIGRHFTPMVATAPVLSLGIPHQKVPCNSCGATTWWAVSQEVPPCAHCGSALSPVIGN